MKSINIYTDGGCSNNQSDENHGGWGAILEYNGHKKELYGSKKNTTNNQMEMKAVIEALKSLKRYDIHINIFSDSAYVIDCFNKKWYVNWEKNGWKTSSKKPVENRELWEELIALFRRLESVNFYRMKGHLEVSKQAEIKKWYEKFKKWNGEHFTMEDFLYVVDMNNRADELANVGISEIK